MKCFYLLTTLKSFLSLSNSLIIVILLGDVKINLIFIYQVKFIFRFIWSL